MAGFSEFRFGAINTILGKITVIVHSSENCSFKTLASFDEPVISSQVMSYRCDRPMVVDDHLGLPAFVGGVSRFRQSAASDTPSTTATPATAADPGTTTADHATSTKPTPRFHAALPHLYLNPHHAVPLRVHRFIPTQPNPAGSRRRPTNQPPPPP